MIFRFVPQVSPYRFTRPFGAIKTAIAARVLTVCLAALTGIVSPQVGRCSPDAAMPGTILKTLPNGLRVIVREDHSAPLVAIDLWVRGGSGAEGRDESGTAHFLEHLIFKGTPTRAAGEIDAAFGDLG